MSKFIYFDHAAATPLDSRVFEAMKPYLGELYGNPSSVYQFAQKARCAIDEAREKASGILRCQPREIIFTSSGTESNNLFIFGAAGAQKNQGHHIITTKIEHDSVRKPLARLEKEGFDVTYLDVGEDGVVAPADVLKALRRDTIFVTIMYANNEIGTIQPISEIGEIIRKFREHKIKKYPQPLFHTDACQGGCYLDLSIADLHVDAMTLNSGKIYGPKGAGAFYLKEGVEIAPQILGGAQEYRMRAGTENVPAIVGFGEALLLAQADRGAETRRLLPLRDKLIDGILRNIPQSRLNGDRSRRLPNNVNVSFRGLSGEAILMRLDVLGIAASAGSACSSGSLEPSHVIQALGLSEEWTHSATRFTLGRGNMEEEVDFLLENLPGIIEELRQTSPFA